ncbi:DUF4839 domain-containing protein [Streptomyces hydrogenans]
MPRLLIGAAAGGFVVLAIIIGVAAALEGKGEKESNKPTTATASAGPSATPTPAAAGAAAAVVITSGTNAEFAALLKTPDSCDSSILDFATKYVGKTVAFDGSIMHMAPHGDYDTRYDFLLGPGDQDPKTEGGPVGHEGGDVGAVRVVASVGEVAEPGDGVGDALVVAEDGAVDADDELEDRGGDGDTGDAALPCTCRAAASIPLRWDRASGQCALSQPSLSSSGLGMISVKHSFSDYLV